MLRRYGTLARQFGQIAKDLRKTRPGPVTWQAGFPNLLPDVLRLSITGGGHGGDPCHLPNANGPSRHAASPHRQAIVGEALYLASGCQGLNEIDYADTEQRYLVLRQRGSGSAGSSGANRG